MWFLVLLLPCGPTRPTPVVLGRKKYNKFDACSKISSTSALVRPDASLEVRRVDRIVLDENKTSR